MTAIVAIVSIGKKRNVMIPSIILDDMMRNKAATTIRFLLPRCHEVYEYCSRPCSLNM